MRLSKHFKSSSFEKSIQQKKDSLNQSYQKALDKFNDKPSFNTTTKRYHVTESNYYDGMLFSNPKPKKAYPVVPTYNEIPSKYTKNYYNLNSNAPSGTFTFNLKSPEKESNHQGYHYYKPNSISNQNSYYNDYNSSPRKQSKPIFSRFESRYDYLTKTTQHEAIESPVKQITKYTYFTSQRPLSNNSFNKYSSPEKTKTTSQISPTVSPSGKLHYLSLDLATRNQGNKQAPTSENNNLSPIRSPTNFKEFSRIPPKSKYENVQNVPSNSTQLTMTSSTSTKGKIPPGYTAKTEITKPTNTSISSATNIPTSEITRPPTTSKIETSKLPTGPSQLSKPTKMETSLPTTKLPAASSTPVSPKTKTSVNTNESYKQTNQDDLESIKDQTDFLDQVEKGIEEDAKENSDFMLREEMIKYNLDHSKNNDQSSPNKSFSSEEHNSFGSPGSFKSTGSHGNTADLDIEIVLDNDNTNFASDDEYDNDELIIFPPTPSKSIKIDSYEFPKMLDILCTQDFFIKPDLKFMIESTIGLSDKMTSNLLKKVLSSE